jgi:hypothetical protein
MPITVVGPQRYATARALIIDGGSDHLFAYGDSPAWSQSSTDGYRARDLDWREQARSDALRQALAHY